MKIFKNISFLGIVGALVGLWFGNDGTEINLFDFDFYFITKAEMPAPATSTQAFSDKTAAAHLRNLHRVEYESCNKLKAKYEQYNAHNNPSRKILALQAAELEKCTARLARSAKEYSEIDAFRF